MTGISQGRRSERRRRSGTPGTVCPSGPTICGPASSWPSPGAGSAPGGASAPGPRWWTTWSPTGGTGPGSSTGPISRACASAVTIEKQRRNRRKNGGERLGDKCGTGGRLGRTPAGLSCLPAPAASLWLARTRPRPGKVLRPSVQDRAAPSVWDFLPTEKQGLRRGKEAVRCRDPGKN